MTHVPHPHRPLDDASTLGACPEEPMTELAQSEFTKASLKTPVADDGYTAEVSSVWTVFELRKRQFRLANRGVSPAEYEAFITELTAELGL